MKKTILIIALVLISALTFAQSKKDTAKAVPVKYNYFIVVPAADFQQLQQTALEFKRLQMYDPQTTAEQKVQMFKGIETYFKALPGRLKVDSVAIGALPKK